jgi:hypothetical protein
MSDEKTGPTIQSQGGKARMRSLTPEQRSEAARLAAQARWVLPKELNGGALKVGELELPCFVVDGGGAAPLRLLSQAGLLAALKMKKGSNPRQGGDRLSNFMAGKLIKPFVSAELASTIQTPIRFRLKNGVEAHGYQATVLPDICRAVIELERTGAIQEQQRHIAERAWILYDAFARVGIIALVDEATGYQADRARDELAKILEAFIAKELQPWVSTFPADYYKEMFRLRGWAFPPKEHPTSRPPLVGKLTNSIVYDRLAPGVLDALRRDTPRDEKGRLKSKLHQRLTPDKGHPKLKEHLIQVCALMRATTDWPSFLRLLDRSLPAHGRNFELPIEV